MDINKIILRCKKCDSIWSITTLKGGNKFEYCLVCPYCSESGNEKIEVVRDASS